MFSHKPDRKETNMRLPRHGRLYFCAETRRKQDGWADGWMWPPRPLPADRCIWYGIALQEFICYTMHDDMLSLGCASLRGRGAWVRGCGRVQSGSVSDPGSSGSKSTRRIRARRRRLLACCCSVCSLSLIMAIIKWRSGCQEGQCMGARGRGGEWKKQVSVVRARGEGG